MWNPAANGGSGEWSTLGDGLDNQVRDMVLDKENNLLYVGGLFEEANGEPANRIAVWDITDEEWISLGDSTGLEGVSCGS